MLVLALITLELSIWQCKQLVSQGEDRRWYHEIVLPGFVNEMPANWERLFAYPLTLLIPIAPIAFVIGQLADLILGSARVRSWLTKTA